MINMLHEHNKQIQREKRNQYVHFILYMHNETRGLPPVKLINTKEMNSWRMISHKMENSCRFKRVVTLKIISLPASTSFSFKEQIITVNLKIIF